MSDTPKKSLFTPNPGVMEQQQRLADAIRGDSPAPPRARSRIQPDDPLAGEPDEVYEDEEEQQPAPRRQPAPHHPPPSRPVIRYKVVLESAHMRLTIESSGVSVSEHGVAIVLDKGSAIMEPKMETEFTIHINGEAYPVIYYGGVHAFPDLDLSFLSFVRKSQEAQPTGEPE